MNPTELRDRVRSKENGSSESDSPESSSEGSPEGSSEGSGASASSRAIGNVVPAIFYPLSEEDEKEVKQVMTESIARRRRAFHQLPYRR
jgi:hypothetical protein